MLFQIPRKLLVIDEGIFGNSIDELVRSFPPENLRRIGNARTKWRVEQSADGNGHIATAILDRNPTSGEVSVLGAIECGHAPRHSHPGGEVILTLAGTGFDETDEGKTVKLLRGSVIIHKPGVTHEPRAVRNDCLAGFWVFYYYQPMGSVLEERMPT